MSNAQTSREQVLEGLEPFLTHARTTAPVHEEESSKHDEGRRRLARALRNQSQVKPRSQKYVGGFALACAAAAFLWFARPVQDATATNFWVIHNARENEGVMGQSVASGAEVLLANGVRFRVGEGVASVRFDAQQHPQLRLENGQLTFLSSTNARAPNAPGGLAIVLGSCGWRVDVAAVVAGDYARCDGTAGTELLFARGAQATRMGNVDPSLSVRAVAAGAVTRFAHAAENQTPTWQSSPNATDDALRAQVALENEMSTTRPLETRARVGESVSLEALLLSARSARAEQDVARAEAILLQVRRRGPRTAEAARAAFELGRIAHGEQSARWLAAYLREAPTGEYRREAMGLLLHATNDKAQWAERYLAEFPQGPESTFARTHVTGLPN